MSKTMSPRNLDTSPVARRISPRPSHTCIYDYVVHPTPHYALFIYGRQGLHLREAAHRPGEAIYANTRT